MMNFPIDYILRFIGIFAKFGVIVLLERSLSTDEFARYILFISIIALASNIFRYGSDNLLYRISTGRSLFQLSKACSDVAILYKKSILIKLILIIVVTPLFSLSEIFTIFLCVESVSLLHYYCLVIRGRGHIRESILLFDVIPPVLLIIMILVISPSYGPEVVLFQHLILLFLVIVCFAKDIRVLRLFLIRHARYGTNSFKRYFKKISPFGLANFSNSFTSWGDVLLITLIFEPDISAAYFMVTRIFTAVERISVIPLYPALNTLGNEFQIRGKVFLSIYRSIRPALIRYFLIIVLGSVGVLVVLAVLPMVFFEALDNLPLVVQVLLIVALVIPSAGAVVDSIGSQTGYETSVLRTALAIMVSRIVSIGIVYFSIGMDFFLYIIASMLPILIGKLLLINKILVRAYKIEISR